MVSRHLDCKVMIWVPSHGRLRVHVHAGPQRRRRITADLHHVATHHHIPQELFPGWHWPDARAAACIGVEHVQATAL